MSAPAPLQFTIYQGATFSERWRRMLVPYPVYERCGKLYSCETKLPVPDDDLTPDDFTGCTAVLQVFSRSDSSVVFELSTTNLGITLNAGGLGWVQADISDEDTDAFVYSAYPAGGAWDSAVGQMMVTRPGGQVDPLFMIDFALRPKVPV